MTASAETRKGRNRVYSLHLALIIAAVTGGMVFAGMLPDVAVAQETDKKASLSVVVERVERSFPQVKPFDAQALAKRHSAATLPPIIFDVREAAEYDVSHLPQAIRLPPSTSPQKFIQEYGDLLQLMPQRPVIFYCYVGYSSFAMADKIAAAFPSLARRVYALEGGIFRWHDQRLLLVDALGPTDAIHPHDFMWRGFLNRAEHITYEARQKTGH